MRDEIASWITRTGADIGPVAAKARPAIARWNP
jgi:hypothetical protein